MLVVFFLFLLIILFCFFWDYNYWGRFLFFSNRSQLLNEWAKEFNIDPDYKNELDLKISIINQQHPDFDEFCLEPDYINGRFDELISNYKRQDLTEIQSKDNISTQSSSQEFTKTNLYQFISNQRKFSVKKFILLTTGTLSSLIILEIFLLFTEIGTSLLIVPLIEKKVMERRGGQLEINGLSISPSLLYFGWENRLLLKQPGEITVNKILQQIIYKDEKQGIGGLSIKTIRFLKDDVETIITNFKISKEGAISTDLKILKKNSFEYFSNISILGRKLKINYSIETDDLQKIHSILRDKLGIKEKLHTKLEGTISGSLSHYESSHKIVLGKKYFFDINSSIEIEGDRVISKLQLKNSPKDSPNLELTLDNDLSIKAKFISQLNLTNFNLSSINLDRLMIENSELNIRTNQELVYSSFYEDVFNIPSINSLIKLRRQFNVALPEFSVDMSSIFQNSNLDIHLSMHNSNKSIELNSEVGIATPSMKLNHINIRDAKYKSALFEVRINKYTFEKKLLEKLRSLGLLFPEGFVTNGGYSYELDNQGYIKHDFVLSSEDDMLSFAVQIRGKPEQYATLKSLNLFIPKVIDVSSDLEIKDGKFSFNSIFSAKHIFRLKEQNWEQLFNLTIDNGIVEINGDSQGDYDHPAFLAILRKAVKKMRKLKFKLNQ